MPHTPSQSEHSLRILLVEPYMTGSHAAWAEGFARHSGHEVEILSLPGRHWKWRMHGAAITLAEQFRSSAFQPEWVLATDMLDLASFLGLVGGRLKNAQTALYFHENQLTYPWSPTDSDPQSGRDNHYAFINYTSALAADRVYFNSRYHLESFLGELPTFLRAFPDHQGLENVDRIRQKSEVWKPGLDLRRLDVGRDAADQQGPPRLLWNHRWEYDKDPEAFFGAMFQLAEEGLDFELAILGERYASAPSIFEQARERLGGRVVAFGFADSAEEYARHLWRADILPVTSRQDFFGISVAEAMYCETVPLLPDRLAFPEHLSPEWAEKCLYRSPAEFLSRLGEMLKGQDLPPRGALRRMAQGYDWRSL